MKRPVREYDAVFVYETDFQKSVIDRIVASRPRDERRLVIDARGGKIRMDGEEYAVNLNGFKPVLKSWAERKKLPRVVAGELVCTAVTGINCRLFPAIFDYRTLSLIDDGTGTPVILKEGRYILRSLHLAARFAFAWLYVKLQYCRNLPGDRKLLSRVDKYYTIYPFMVEGYKDSFIGNAAVCPVDYFSRVDFRVRPGVGFVSTGESPVKGSELALVKELEGAAPEYYPHPHEDLSRVDKGLVGEIVRPEGTLESYFVREGIPGRLYGEISTVFLNLKMMECPVYMTVFYRFDKTRKGYYDLFREAGIELREV